MLHSRPRHQSPPTINIPKIPPLWSLQTNPSRLPKLYDRAMILPLVDAYIRRCFAAAGLRRQTIELEPDTTVSFWAPKPPSADTVDARPPLLLIHGFGPTATWQWRSQVGALSRHFRLVVPDLLFFGGSTTKSPQRSERFQAETVVRLADKVIGAGEGFGVVGTSYGGFVAYHVARMLGPERVSRAVIASSDLLKGEEDDAALRQRAGVENVTELLIPRSTAALRRLIGLVFHREFRFLPEFLLRDALRNMYSDRLKEKEELIKGTTLGNKDEFQLTPLPQDVLIIWGEHDRIFPLEKAHELKKRLGEKARLEIVKNTGHVPNAEDSRRFNEILLDFLLAAPKP